MAANPMKPLSRKCPNCHKPTVDMVVAEYSADVEHDGRPYSLIIPDLLMRVCSECGNRALDRESSDRITVALRQAAGLLSPERIRSNRTKLQLTQKELAEHLGIAEATLSRWETGSQIQQRAFDQVLRLFFEVPEARKYYGYVDRSVATADRAKSYSAAAPTQVVFVIANVTGGQPSTSRR